MTLTGVEFPTTLGEDGKLYIQNIGESFKVYPEEKNFFSVIKHGALQTPVSYTHLDVYKSQIRNRAVRHLEKGRVVIFGCGTGNPFFSTDTAAALRAAEIDADIIMKATNVDGVYDADPNKNPDANKLDSLTFLEVLSKELQVMDSTAASLCKDNKIPILVFNLDNPDNIVSALLGENIGTIVKED